MKLMKILSTLALLVFAQTSFAMPNPTYTSLAESLPVTQYIYDNMTTIIDSSAELAKKAVPNAHYFLVTDKITIFPPTAFSKEINEGTAPVATFSMSGSLLKCERDLFTKIQYDDWGGKKAQQFFLKDEIRCVRK